MKLKIFSIATRVIKSIFLLVFLAFLLGATFQSSLAGEFVIKDQASCESFGGTWIPPNGCQVIGFSLASGDTLRVMANVILGLSGGNNNGTINNYGEILLHPALFTNFGTINNYGTIIDVVFLA